ncbi:MAG: Unknown protein [uncultured Sulfurovum sp.]|uniref:Uncharacterized protein n=1 Tax=uncultured Sulfurovum sp. TaxID=269237 RepID=A0A6S6SHM3_9BACT|nr:MAG: Unknown protein [uncultured Sulfurovum sp.]
MLSKILYKGKDLALSTAIKTLINKKLSKFGGTVTALMLNTKEQKIELKIGLKGELEPLQVVVNHYEIIEEQGTTYLMVSNIETSREWMNLVAENYLHKKRFTIPKKYVKTIKTVS